MLQALLGQPADPADPDAVSLTTPTPGDGPFETPGSCAVLAHNLIRWTATIGQSHSVDHLTMARTIRQRLIAIPARIVNRAGTLTSRGPTNWPWAQSFQTRLRVIRLLALATG